jgi:hypothetical protein
MVVVELVVPELEELEEEELLDSLDEDLLEDVVVRGPVVLVTLFVELVGSVLPRPGRKKRNPTTPATMIINAAATAAKIELVEGKKTIFQLEFLLFFVRNII